MSRVLLQILLSVLVAAGTAVSFGTDLRGEAHKGLRQVGALLHEAGHSLPGVDADLDAELEASAGTSLASRMDENFDLEVETSASVSTGRPSKKPKQNRQAPYSVGSSAGAELETGGPGPALEFEVDSELELETGFEN